MTGKVTITCTWELLWNIPPKPSPTCQLEIYDTLSLALSFSPRSALGQHLTRSYG
jgi:hypothetical protein